eukprot:826856-Rhodomonas_salina.1
MRVEPCINRQGSGRRTAASRASFTPFTIALGNQVGFDPWWDHARVPCAASAQIDSLLGSMVSRGINGLLIGLRIDDRLDNFPTPLQWVEVGPVEHLDVT